MGELAIQFLVAVLAGIAANYISHKLNGKEAANSERPDLRSRGVRDDFEKTNSIASE